MLPVLTEPPMARPHAIGLFALALVLAGGIVLLYTADGQGEQLAAETVER
jgi:hypothetical protein